MNSLIIKVYLLNFTKRVYMLTSLKCHLSSYLPFNKTGGTISARYCYSVWLRHMVSLKSNVPNFKIPEVIAEFGPGDSIGTGLAGLISGAEKYYSFDVVKYANPERNLKIFDELVELFKKRADIPSKDEFPHLKPYLDSYEFPNHIFTEKHIENMLNKDRVNSIRNAITEDKKDENDSKIVYAAPWMEYEFSLNNSIDLIYSQAVLEHVENLEDTYKYMYQWLKDRGYMSHQIDFKCHGTAKEWNGHWKYSDSMWNFIKGRRKYLINREPLSTHIKLLNKNNFKIIEIIKVKDSNGITKEKINEKYNYLTNEDFYTSSALLQSIK